MTDESLKEEILINVTSSEVRAALLENGVLQEVYIERSARRGLISNIYKGRVTNVGPAIQAAFVDYGQGQNGFLHISDLHPQYFPGQPRTERVGKKIPRRHRPPTIGSTWCSTSTAPTSSRGRRATWSRPCATSCAPGCGRATG